MAVPGVDYRPGPEPDLTGVRVGVPRTYYFEHVDADVAAAVRHAIAQLEALGARLIDIGIPMTRYIQAVQWGLMVPEATAYHQATLRAVPELYQADVRILLEAGELMGAGDHLRAQRARTLMRDAWARILEEVDVIAAPAVPMAAVPSGQETVTWPDGTVESVSDAYVRLSSRPTSQECPHSPSRSAGTRQACPSACSCSGGPSPSGRCCGWATPTSGPSPPGRSHPSPEGR